MKNANKGGTGTAIFYLSREMKEDVHSLRIGDKRVPDRHKEYTEEVAEISTSIKKADKKIFRVKVLIDADRIDRCAVNDIIGQIKELL